MTSSNFIHWVGEKKKCYWPEYENTGYNFYASVKYFNNIFQVGAGAYVKGVNKNFSRKRDIARIHCFYENMNFTKLNDRYRAIVELFKFPCELKEIHECNSDKFHEDFDIIQIANWNLFDIPIEKLQKCCTILFATHKDDPEEVIKQNFKKKKNCVYVCRYILYKTNDKHVLKCAIRNMQLLTKRTNSLFGSIKGNNKFVFKSISKSRKTLLNQQREVFEKLGNESSAPTEISEVCNSGCNCIDENKTSRYIQVSPVRVDVETQTESVNLSVDKDVQTAVISKENLNCNSISNIKDEENKTSKYTQVNISENFKYLCPERKAVQIQTESENLNLNKSVQTATIIKENLNYNPVANFIDENKTSKFIQMHISENLKYLCPERKTIRTELVNLSHYKGNQAATVNKENLSWEDISILFDDFLKYCKDKALSFGNENVNVGDSEGNGKNTFLNYLKLNNQVDKDVNKCNTDSTNQISNKNHSEYTASIDQTKKSPVKLKLGIVTPRKIENRIHKRHIEETHEVVDDIPLPKLAKKNASSIKFVKLSNRNESNKKNISQKLIVDSGGESLKKNVKTKYSDFCEVVSSIAEKSENASVLICETDKKKSPMEQKLAYSAHFEFQTTDLRIIKNPFDHAQEQLLSGLMSGPLPCRKKEFNMVAKFINRKLTTNCGGCMYICGVPGTGKTTTISNVLDSFKDILNKCISNVKILFVNALNLRKPRQIYTKIVRQMTNKNMSWEKALIYIHKFFVKRQHDPYILYVDEFNKLCTRKQNVLYNLLDLPRICRSPLIVLAVSNAFNLPEILYKKKLSSQLGITKLVFKPYKCEQLVSIINTRLDTNNSIFKDEAIEYVARKIAALSGDCRRALNICSRAIEIAKSAQEKIVTIDIVNKTLQDMISLPTLFAIRSCSNTEKIILHAIVYEISRTGSEEVPFTNVVQVVDDLCLLNSITVPTIAMLLRSCRKLHYYGVIIMQDGNRNIKNMLLLNVNSFDVQFALNQKL